MLGGAKTQRGCSDDETSRQWLVYISSNTSNACARHTIICCQEDAVLAERFEECFCRPH